MSVTTGRKRSEVEVSDWWDRHLRRTDAPLEPQPGALPRKAVRWQENYPPVAPPTEPGYVAGIDPEMGEYYRVRKQGFISTPPPSAREAAAGRCPECGGNNFFRRRWANTECAPLCVDCGYNGDYFTQSGALLNAVGLHSAGPVQFARSDNPSGESGFSADPGMRGFDATAVR